MSHLMEPPMFLTSKALIFKEMVGGTGIELKNRSGLVWLLTSFEGLFAWDTQGHLLKYFRQ